MWRLMVVALAHLLCAAHVMFRFGSLELALAVGIAPMLLWVIRRPVIRYIEQILLGLYALEWVRIGVVIVMQRLENDQPYLRAGLIYVGVALFTASMMLLLNHPRVKRYFGAR